MAPWRAALLLLVLLAATGTTAKPKRGKRLRDGDREPCACHGEEYAVLAAERACAAEEDADDLLPLCSAGGADSAPIRRSARRPPPAQPPPPGPEAKKAAKSLSPRERAAAVPDHLARPDTAAALTALVQRHTVVLLTIGTEQEESCRPCATLAPNLKLAAAAVNSSWSEDSYAAHETAALAVTSSTSSLGQAIAAEDYGINSLPTLLLFVNASPREGDELPRPRARLDKDFRKVIWNEAGLSGFVIDELRLAESARMLKAAEDLGDATEYMHELSHSGQFDALREKHSLVFVKAVKTGCKHCEHLEPHFAAAAAATLAGLQLRSDSPRTGKISAAPEIAFAIARDNAAMGLFQVDTWPTMFLFQQGQPRAVLTLTRNKPQLEWRGAVLSEYLLEQVARAAAGVPVTPPSAKSAQAAAVAARAAAAKEAAEKGEEGEEGAPGCCDGRGAAGGIEVQLPPGLVSLATT